MSVVTVLSSLGVGHAVVAALSAAGGYVARWWRESALVKRARSDASALASRARSDADAAVAKAKAEAALAVAAAHTELSKLRSLAGGQPPAPPPPA